MIKRIVVILIIVVGCLLSLQQRALSQGRDGTVLDQTEELDLEDKVKDTESTSKKRDSDSHMEVEPITPPLPPKGGVGPRPCDPPKIRDSEGICR